MHSEGDSSTVAKNYACSGANPGVQPIKLYADPAPGSLRRWAIFWMGSVNFLVSMFYRVSTAVISPALVRELGFTSSQLGDLSAVFFYAFAFSQLPIGVAMDRLGPRKTMGILIVVGMAGTVLFAVGRTPTELIISRALLGIGMSGNLMVPFAMIAAWFPVNRFALLSGSVVSIGSLGTLMAATPLAYMSLSLGWRETFLIFAALNASVAVAFLVIARNRPEGSATPSYQSRALTAGLKHVFGMYSYWAISMSSLVRYGYITALQSLWAVPFLVYGLGLDDIEASNAILFMGIGYIVCLPVSGWVSDSLLRSRKNVVLPSLVVYCVLVLSFSWWTPSVPQWLIMVTCLAFGMAAAPGQILYAHMTEIVPVSMLSQAMTALNLFTALGGGVMTHLLSILIGGEPTALSGPADFRVIWYAGAIALAVACLLYAPVPDSQALKPKEAVH